MLLEVNVIGMSTPSLSTLRWAHYRIRSCWANSIPDVTRHPMGYPTVQSGSIPQTPLHTLRVSSASLPAISRHYAQAIRRASTSKGVVVKYAVLSPTGRTTVRTINVANGPTTTTIVKMEE